MRIIILGAGPAGTSCAIQLRKAGFSVRLLDIASFPRFKPGESCHPGIEPLLNKLDVWQEIEALNPLRYSSIFINSEASQTEEFFNEDKTWQGFQFPRESFDTVLLDKANSLGAKFLPETKTYKILTNSNNVTSIITDKGEFSCDYLIDATGSKSLSSIKLGLQREKLSKPIISNYSQIFTKEILDKKFNSYFEITNDYWGYISLIKPHTYSITHSSNTETITDNNAFLKKHFSNKYTEIISMGFETTWRITNNSKFENLFLVGDALMTFDPTSSKGIVKSIMTGIYAAHILVNIKADKITLLQGKNLYRQWANNFIKKEIASIKLLLPLKMVENLFF